MKLVVAALVAISLSAPGAASEAEWTLVRSSHFEIFSQAGEHDGRAALAWFEQLRAFFVQAGGFQPADSGTRPVRVIGFKSASEYAAFRLHAADAYYVGGEAADYIVMPGLGSAEFAVAAHEYAHLVLHSAGARLPSWLAEGIAELFSTMRIDQQRCVIGGDLQMRKLVLRRKAWIPVEALLGWRAESSVAKNRDRAEMFYAESWALTDMLVFSPAYQARFGELLQAAESSDFDVNTMSRMYGKPVGIIQADLRAWIETTRAGTLLPGIPDVREHIEVNELTAFESERMLADLLFARGDLDGAEAAYKKLAEERPSDAAVAVAQGSIALRKGDRAAAREQWKRAMSLGVQDATVCYQYAILADEAGTSMDEIAVALRRAIDLKPNFDDARYRLALLESNAGQYEAAVEQLRAMRTVAAGRAYGYWSAMASALTETDQREEAKQAAAQAMKHATTAEERASASRLAYMADTDLTVQLSKDANGNMRVVTARKPHGAAGWNPFIEPGDDIHSVEGRIEKVECISGKITGLRIANGAEAVEVALPDPSRVQVGGGAAEFVCGAEDGRKVAIQYAAVAKGTDASGVLRGLQFK